MKNKKAKIYHNKENYYDDNYGTDSELEEIMAQVELEEANRKSLATVAMKARNSLQEWRGKKEGLGNIANGGASGGAILAHQTDNHVIQAAAQNEAIIDNGFQFPDIIPQSSMAPALNHTAFGQFGASISLIYSDSSQGSTIQESESLDKEHSDMDTIDSSDVSIVYLDEISIVHTDMEMSRLSHEELMEESALLEHLDMQTIDFSNSPDASMISFDEISIVNSDMETSLLSHEELIEESELLERSAMETTLNYEDCMEESELLERSAMETSVNHEELMEESDVLEGLVAELYIPFGAFENYVEGEWTNNVSAVATDLPHVATLSHWDHAVIGEDSMWSF
jgi:hypothetical protein